MAEKAEKEAEYLSLVENTQRDELNPMEKADAFNALTEAPYNKTIEEISKEAGFDDRNTPSKYLTLLKLPPEVQEMVRRRTISMSHGMEIARLILPRPLATLSLREREGVRLTLTFYRIMASLPRVVEPSDVMR